MERDPAFGGIFENMVIVDILKHRYNQGKEAGLFFFRDHHGNEVDLLVPSTGKKITSIPVEIKSSRTYRSDFLKGITYFKKLVPESPPGLLIYDGDLEFENPEGSALNFRNTGEFFQHS